MTALASALSQLDRPAEALPVIEEAVGIFRELTATSPDQYRPDLATALTALGGSLGMLGRSTEAVPVTEEAVGMYRELAAASPDQYHPNLTVALTNLAALDRTNEADAAHAEVARLE